MPLQRKVTNNDSTPIAKKKRPVTGDIKSQPKKPIPPRAKADATKVSKPKPVDPKKNDRVQDSKLGLKTKGREIFHNYVVGQEPVKVWATGKNPKKK